MICLLPIPTCIPPFFDNIYYLSIYVVVCSLFLNSIGSIFLSMLSIIISDEYVITDCKLQLHVSRIQYNSQYMKCIMCGMKEAREV